ncbi:MAG: DUF1573 domain-containing protein [Chloroflexi bacterium]|nr:MAG: DUF1573 domain-containing protein [Chloroflexota bacterium]
MKSDTKTQRAERRKRERERKSLIMMVAGGGLILAVAVFAFIMNRPEPKAAIEVKGAPSIKVDSEKVNLGDVRLGKTVNVSFQLTNIGDQELKITDTPYVEVVEGC